MLAMCSDGWKLRVLLEVVYFSWDGSDTCRSRWVLQLRDKLRQYCTTWKKVRGGGKGGGCLTTITLKVLSFQNKSIYLLYTLTVTYKLRSAHQHSLNIAYS